MAKKASPGKPDWFDKGINSIDGVPTVEGLCRKRMARHTYIDDKEGTGDRVQISVEGQQQIKEALAANAERTIREGNHRGVNHRFDLER